MEDKKSAKTVCDIQINWVKNAIDPREQFLEDYHHCPLCGSELLFTHVTQFVTGSVAERAQCEDCHIQVKSSDHSLQ